MTDSTAQRKVLMISYVFPPFYSIGGSIRVVKFIKYLPSVGWLPTVLTIDDQREYETQHRRGSEELLRDLPPEVEVFRTGSGEPPRELLEKGRRARDKSRLAALLISFLSRLRWLATRYLLLPDETITWLPFATRLGRRLVRERGIDLLFATCPPHSVALTGALLKRLTGVPLVLDFRDDWIDTPPHRSKPKIVQWLERRLEKWAVKTADRLILVTEWSRDAFLGRYPDEPVEKFVFLPNGCDLEDFSPLAPSPVHQRDDRFRMLHCGILSPAETWKRSPETLFTALANLRERDSDFSHRLSLTFTGHLAEPHRALLSEYGLTGVVEEAGFLPIEEYVRSMRGADLLLAINFDEFPTLIPGKLYEYWAVGGPPILLLSCTGAATDLVRRYNLGLSAPPRDVKAVEDAISTIYEQWRNGSPLTIRTEGIERYDRKSLATELSEILVTTRSATEQAPP